MNLSIPKTILAPEYQSGEGHKLIPGPIHVTGRMPQRGRLRPGFSSLPRRCEGNLVATSVTTLIARTGSADLAGQAGGPFLRNLLAWSKRTTVSNRGGPVFGQEHTDSCAPLLEPPNKLSSLVGTVAMTVLITQHPWSGDKYWGADNNVSYILSQLLFQWNCTATLCVGDNFHFTGEKANAQGTEVSWGHEYIPSSKNSKSGPPTPSSQFFSLLGNYSDLNPCFLLRTKF